MFDSLDFKSESRGMSEVVYLAILAMAIVGIGGVGLMMGSGLTDTTKQQIQETDFEVTDPVHQEVEYSSRTELKPSDVEKLYVLNEDDQRYVLYNGTQRVDDPDTDYNGTISEGDVVLNDDAVVDVDYGDTLTFIIETPTGDSYVADEVYIPPMDSLGGGINSTGNVSVSNNTNLGSTVELETAGYNNS